MFIIGLMFLGVLTADPSSADWLDLIKTVGLGLAVLGYFQFQFMRGKLHSDVEFQREVTRADKLDAKLDRIISVQEEITETIKEAIGKRAEISSIDDLVKLADHAREQGLIK